MTRPEAVAVVVPARDEERLLPACLDSVARAVEALARAPGVACRVFVVLDSCRDGTADVVARPRGVTAVPVAAGYVGAPAPRASRRPPSGHGASTRPDVDRQHRRRHRRATTLADGAGRPRGRRPRPRRRHGAARPGDLTDHELRLWRERHTLGDGHEHVHGANLGFTLAAYRGVGGFPHLSVHEDVGLVLALRRSGVPPWIAAGGLAAVTSGRREGRAPHGFAAYLDGLGA